MVSHSVAFLLHKNYYSIKTLEKIFQKFYEKIFLQKYFSLEDDLRLKLVKINKKLNFTKEIFLPVFSL